MIDSQTIRFGALCATILGALYIFFVADAADRRAALECAELGGDWRPNRCILEGEQ